MVMSNVVPFPGKSRLPTRIEAVTGDLHEALWMAAILLKDWEDLAFDIGGGRVTLVDEDGSPSADPFGSEPVIVLASTRRTVSEVISLATALDGAAPLPGHMLIFFAIWNSDDPEDPILTYADAIEMMDGALSNIDWERENRAAAGGRV